MSTTRATLTPVPMSLDHRIERVRAQLAELATYRGKGSPTRSLQEFDQETEALIAEQLGDVRRPWDVADESGRIALGIAPPDAAIAA